MTGRKPRTAIDLALWKGTMLATATKSEVSQYYLMEVTSKLAEAIDAMHGDVAVSEATAVDKRVVNILCKNIGVYNSTWQIAV